MGKKLSIRTAERLIRNAYDLEELATRLKYDGHTKWADSVRALDSDMGKVGRSMARELEDAK